MKEFDYIETLENAVAWHYFKGTLGWDDDKIAYEMCLHPRRLKEWVNGRASVITKLMKADPGKTESIRMRLEEKYPLPEIEGRKRIKLEINAVVKVYKEGKETLQELAKHFKVDLNDFRLWWNDNLQVINSLVRRHGE